MGSKELNESGDTISNILYVALFLGVMLLAIVVTLGALGQANVQQNGNVTSSGSASEAGYVNATGYTLLQAGQQNFVPTITSLSNSSDPKLATNETGYANSTGYTLAKSTGAGFSTPVIVSIWNGTESLNSGNYTLTGNVLTNKTARSFDALNVTYTWSNVILVGNATVTSGVVKNATAIQWNNMLIGYTYTYDSTNSTAVNSGIVSVKNNVVSMVSNFFALMPTVGTILAVVILIAGIVILVIYVRRMGTPRENTEGFVG